jgi:hypothetical protein
MFPPGFAISAAFLFFLAGRKVFRSTKSSQGKAARLKLDLDISMFFLV